MNMIIKTLALLEKEIFLTFPLPTFALSRSILDMQIYFLHSQPALNKDKRNCMSFLPLCSFFQPSPRRGPPKRNGRLLTQSSSFFDFAATALLFSLHWYALTGSFPFFAFPLRCALQLECWRRVLFQITLVYGRLRERPHSLHQQALTRNHANAKRITIAIFENVDHVLAEDFVPETLCSSTQKKWTLGKKCRCSNQHTFYVSNG